MEPMFQLDGNFLNELGLEALPDDKKQAFLQHIYTELEMRAGEKLTEGMSDEKLDEFGNFVDRNAQGMMDWFDENMPDFTEREDFKELEASADGADIDIDSLLSQYGAMVWLQINRPDYPQVVMEVLEEIKKEIIANRDAILSE